MLNPLTAPGQVIFVGAGPGSIDHLTMGACRALTQAEVVIHDRLVGPEILDLIPPQALRIEAGKEGFGPSTPQETINALIVDHAASGRRVVRLKSGDSGIFGRLDEEIEALDAAGLGWRIVPGLTTAAAAAAAIGQGLTKRGRNAALRIVTGHDMAGYAEQDWRGLARVGEVAAIYMGKKSARFIQGRLMMHGADPETPATVIENVSRADERIVAATLATLPEAVAGLSGPAIVLYGLAPRRAAAALPLLKEATA
ncbi:uroporphyrinogen-III C-methyltransferase [Cereibacter sphaeroides]|uniref:uroporphyrinogen-III C-methyltransferase n=1 Tax=Cereibacter sphaeroides TaxID=1063 RepID=A0AAX1UJB5_CERSP|nr:uroporphyrinogen-III C-methyltransferase [Cereibacter sphaeroides]AZB56242.1 uroporphyrinogen-III C-methyltransferase [Cereibacter sphaeroides]AZB60494.1 uroporphyrinogen-III C-methyltransferase [Cereibacter sphaeroides]RHZ93675.1 uroporphyrinogen-III C-methyltransferase [Cereibacter sphaeroides]